MTPWELFTQTFQDKWMYLKLSNRKTCDYVKVTGTARSLEYSVDVFKINHDFTVGKSKTNPDKMKNFRLNQALDTLTYFKLFKRCEFIEDEELLNKLNKIEAKLKLRT